MKMIKKIDLFQKNTCFSSKNAFILKILQSIWWFSDGFSM